jgi:PPM family protein phosphatase
MSPDARRAGEFSAPVVSRPTFAWGVSTHVGGVRDHNEDAYVVSEHACVVADGMGGHEAGEVASQLVVRMVADVFASRLLDVSELPAFVATLNDEVQRAGEKNDTPGMGTTVVGVVITENGDTPSAVVFHVGDSRCYRLATGIMTQVTVDHSHVEEMVRAGIITRHEALTHPLRNVVTRALGAEPTVEADFFVLPDEGCRLLLCSDGLSGEIHDDQIWDVLTSHPDPSNAAAALVRAVLDGPARDNVTAIVVDIVPANREYGRRIVQVGEVVLAAVDTTAEVDITQEAPAARRSSVGEITAEPVDDVMRTIPWAPSTRADWNPPNVGGATDRPRESSGEAAWGSATPPATRPGTSASESGDSE